MIDKIISFLIKFLIFLLPIFFLPITHEFFEFNKQYLLWILVPIIILLILVKFLSSERIKINRSPLDIPIIILVFAFLLSSVFSVDPFSSFFGYYGRFSGSFLGLLSLVGLFFIFSNYLPGKKRVNAFSLLKVLLYSYSISLFVCFLSIFNLLNKFINLSGVISSSFNLSGGSLEVFSVYASFMLTIVIGYVYYYNSKGAKFNIFWFNLIGIITFFLLIIIDYSVAWYSLILSSILLILFKGYFKKLGLVYKKIDIKVLLPSVIILLSIAILYFSPINLDKKILNRDLPSELKLSYTDTTKISLESFKNNIFLGSGPNTFFYNYSLYRDNNFNDTNYWQFRFDRGGSYILELLGTVSLLGFLSFIMLMIVLFYLFYVYFVFIKNKNLGINNKRRLLLIFLFICFSQVSLIFFLSSVNTIILLFYFLIISLVAVLFKEIKLPIFKEIIIKLRKDSKNQKLFYIIIFLVFSIFISLVGFEIKFFIADCYAKKGTEESLTKAVKYNPSRYNYKINLSKLYLNKVKVELIKPYEFQDDEYIRYYINGAINLALEAVNSRPNSVISQETLGVVYRDLSHITNGGEDRAVEAFYVATKLEPSNPVIYSELGKAQLRAGLYFEAEDSFRRSMELKSDYYEAKFGLARAKIKQGKDLEAIIILNELTLVYNNPEVFYEQGRLYYNKKEINKAINSFSNALKINPNHSNSLYSLGLALELIGEKEKAIEFFKKVSDLNPKNLEIKNKLIN